MKKIIIICLFFITISLFSQNEIFLPQSEIVVLSNEFSKKVLSGFLIKNVSDKEYLFKNNLINENQRKVRVVIYFDHKPDESEIANLRSLGIECFTELWTPPLSNHPYGYIHAIMPSNQLENTLSFSFVKLMDSGEYQSSPNNNTGGQKMKADKVWLQGYTGTGKKVAILDSGIDNFYEGTDFPVGFSRKDYSGYPTITDSVANLITGHGTHVTGSVLGRGVLSVGHNNAYNGSGAFKGSAPDASLIFLKIGNNTNSNANSAAMEAAMDAAVNIYNADILSMSYGGWYTYHDGSSSTEQKVDWVVSQGKSFFLSAGNSGSLARHYSGTVNANSSTDYIQINVTAGAFLYFNLVWSDGIGVNKTLKVDFYNSSYTLLSKTDEGQFESTRGTESNFSYATNSVLAGTYYIKVVNSSSSSQFFHIYESYGANVKFNSPDPLYTIGQPASADNGFAIGAYVSRKYWQPTDGFVYSFNGGNDVEQIAPFSSRGPRIDGLQKPDITAPGTAVISLRDVRVYGTANSNWIDNDGTTPGATNYYVMQGTSMACPLAAGTGALYLSKNTSATPAQLYSALKNFANQSNTDVTPSSTWGYGKIDIQAAINGTPSIDGNLGSEEGYTLLGGTATPVNTGFGSSLFVKRIYARYANDALYLFLEANVNTAAPDHITIWLDFSNYNGLALGQNAGGQGLYNTNPNFKLDMETDYAIDINTGGTTSNCYMDMYRYFSNGLIQADQKMYIGNSGLLGSSTSGPSSNTSWGGTTVTANSVEFAFINTATSLKGFEIKIPLSALPGINTSSVLNKTFSAIASSVGFFSNQTVPENSAQGTNFGNNVDFSTVNVFDYFTSTNVILPVELTNFVAESFDAAIKLSWVTETETQNFGFEIERKFANSLKQNSQWQKIGFIPGNVNSNSKKDYSFADNSAQPGSYYYRLKQIDIDGKFDYSKEILIHYKLPQKFELMQNFPNPFNPITTIKYSIPASESAKMIPVSINIFNTIGQKIKSIENSDKMAGVYEIQFNGSEFPSGIYFIKITAGNFTDIKKMILAK